MKYIRDHYGVPAEVGRIVVMDGERGIITGARNGHVLVNFDKDKPGFSIPCHPTWEMEYLEIGVPRKTTKSQQRYSRYLKCDFAKCFDSFIDYCRWDSEHYKSNGDPKLFSG